MKNELRQQMGRNKELENEMTEVKIVLAKKTDEVDTLHINNEQLKKRIAAL